jgi:hypothetical protein
MVLDPKLKTLHFESKRLAHMAGGLENELNLDEDLSIALEDQKPHIKLS